MIIVFDTETRGLYGDIFLVGCYDGETYQTFYTGKEFLGWLDTLEVEKKEEISVYCFNLDFDLAKLIKESIDVYRKTGKPLFELDYKKSLIIHNKFHVARLVDSPVVFRDLYPLVNCSLDQAAQDFELTTQKLDLGIAEADKDRYFKTVNPDDPDLQQYLRQDVLATWELLHVLVGLSGLELDKFMRCPTLASLAMRMFRESCPASMKLIRESYLDKEEEAFIREAYHGGRVEIFRHLLMDGGYHYDINSLYPHVMEINPFPTGDAKMWKKETSVEKRTEIFHNTRKHKSWFSSHYFIHAKVMIPHQHVCPLPLREERGLIFPKNIFTGYFCSPEMEYALNHCGVEVLEVYGLISFTGEAPLFTQFIQQQKTIKTTSVGAKRNFAKLIQNSLYGKFGMNRKREVYELHTSEREQALREKGIRPAITNTYYDQQVMSHIKEVFVDYIKPHYAALITSYARVELLKKLRALPPEHLYYCDTDSVVSGIAFPEAEVHPKEYGKWKLEREVMQGIYVLPKLYAEIDRLGEHTLKSKGIVKAYQATVSYGDYLEYYKSMVAGKDQILYGYGQGEKFFRRRNLITAIKHAQDPDEKVLLQKCFLFSHLRQKRVFNYDNNTSEPLDLSSELA